MVEDAEASRVRGANCYCRLLARLSVCSSCDVAARRRGATRLSALSLSLLARICEAELERIRAEMVRAYEVPFSRELYASIPKMSESDPLFKFVSPDARRHPLWIGRKSHEEIVKLATGGASLHSHMADAASYALHHVSEHRATVQPMPSCSYCRNEATTDDLCDVHAEHWSRTQGMLAMLSRPPMRMPDGSERRTKVEVQVDDAWHAVTACWFDADKLVVHFEGGKIERPTKLGAPAWRAE